MYSASTLILESKHQGCKKRHFFFLLFLVLMVGRRKKTTTNCRVMTSLAEEKNGGEEEKKKLSWPNEWETGAENNGVGGCYCCLLHCYADISRDIYVLICTDYIYIYVCVCHERRWVGASSWANECVSPTVTSFRLL